MFLPPHPTDAQFEELARTESVILGIQHFDPRYLQIGPNVKKLEIHAQYWTDEILTIEPILYERDVVFVYDRFIPRDPWREVIARMALRVMTPDEEFNLIFDTSSFDLKHRIGLFHRPFSSLDAAERLLFDHLQEKRFERTRELLVPHMLHPGTVFLTHVVLAPGDATTDPAVLRASFGDVDGLRIIHSGLSPREAKEIKNIPNHIVVGDAEKYLRAVDTLTSMAHSLSNQNFAPVAFDKNLTELFGKYLQ
jgi:hypothetical protein